MIKKYNIFEKVSILVDFSNIGMKLIRINLYEVDRVWQGSNLLHTMILAGGKGGPLRPEF